MKIFKHLLIIPMLLATCSSCAREDAPAVGTAHAQPTLETKAAPTIATTETRLDAEGNILVFTSQEDGPVEASLISMAHGDSDLQYQRIMMILNVLPLDKDFVTKAGERLKVNRRLKQEAFVLPLMDENGNSHRFEYISNPDQQLYTLNYRLESADK